MWGPELERAIQWGFRSILILGAAGWGLALALLALALLSGCAGPRDDWSAISKAVGQYTKEPRQ